MNSANHVDMDILREWRRSGLIRDIDLHFAGFIGRIAGNKPDPALLLAAALVSQATCNGHICLALDKVAGKPWPPPPGDAPGPDETGDDDAAPTALPKPITLPAYDEWIRKLKLATDCVTTRMTANIERRPIVLDEKHKRLYLYRYWQCEETVAQNLHARAKAEPDDALVPPAIGEKIRQYFPDKPGATGIGLQRLAVLVGLRRRLVVITGGPGTGKTFIVARLLALMLDAKPDLVVRVAAPTGKAAKRMIDSIHEAVQNLHLSDDIRGRLPGDASTLHRLLGAMGEGIQFRHGPHNPIEADIVIVDEASMIDLPMAARLVGALRPTTRLILLGDMRQLEAVEPGNVFGDLCLAVDRPNAFSTATLDAWKKSGLDAGIPGVTWDGQDGLGDGLVRLTYSHRFLRCPSIAQFSESIVGDDADKAVQVLGGKQDDLTWVRDDLANQLDSICKQYAVDYAVIAKGMKDIGDSESQPPGLLQVAFTNYTDQRLLCALRGGPFGVRRINARIEELLGGKVKGKGREWYPGRPIIITRNNYGQSLMNGDVGLASVAEDGTVRIWFEPASAGGEYRPFPPQLLPEFEVAHALTVHKSQGSEFNKVILVLPDRFSLVLTRELLYTGVTRAKNNVKVLGTEAIIRHAIGELAVRESGLKSALHEC